MVRHGRTIFSETGNALKSNRWACLTAFSSAGTNRCCRLRSTRRRGWAYGFHTPGRSGSCWVAAYQTVLQRGLAAKDDKPAVQCFMYGGGMAMLWYITPFMVGMVARVVYPTINASDAHLTMCNIFGSYAGAFFVVMASQMTWRRCSRWIPCWPDCLRAL